MTATDTERPLVLIVDDEDAVAETYALRLEGVFETRVATGGAQALELMDEAVDAVLLDRRMPDIHGDEVLATMREQGYDCPIIMTTAVDPDLNILTMAFDDYLCKPIVKETLITTLENHLDTDEQAAELDEFFGLIAKIDVLEAELNRAELEASDRYTELKERAGALAPALREEVADFDEMIELYRDIDREA